LGFCRTRRIGRICRSGLLALRTLGRCIIAACCARLIALRALRTRLLVGRLRAALRAFLCAAVIGTLRIALRAGRTLFVGLALLPTLFLRLLAALLAVIGIVAGLDDLLLDPNDIVPLSSRNLDTGNRWRGEGRLHQRRKRQQRDCNARE
jgi:hypothetical protein